jgi:hypothetical protein
MLDRREQPEELGITEDPVGLVQQPGAAPHIELRQQKGHRSEVLADRGSYLALGEFDIHGPGAKQESSHHLGQLLDPAKHHIALRHAIVLHPSRN